MTNLIDTKKTIDYCKNYYDIIEERYTKDDILTKEILNYYKYVISNTHASDPDELNKACLLDKSVYAYFNNTKFHDIIVNDIKTFDKQADLSEFMISKYQTFQNDPLNKITTTKWL